MPPADRRPDDAPEETGATETPSSAFRVFGRIGQEPMWFEEQEAPAPPVEPDEHADAFAFEADDEPSASGPFDFAPDDEHDDPFAAEPDAWAPAGAAREEDDDLAFAGLPVQGFGAPLIPAGDADEAASERGAASTHGAPRSPRPAEARELGDVDGRADSGVAGRVAARSEVGATSASTERASARDADDDATPWYRNAACWAHLSPLGASVLLLTGLGLVPPLLIENTAGRRDEFVRDQAREALNFQLNVLLLNLAALVTLTAPLVWPLSIAFAIVLPIQAAIDANRGVRHRYPIVPRWLD